MQILTVKINTNSYVVNGSIFVPNNPANKDYLAVQEWISAGNIPEPQYTPEELLAKTKAGLTSAIQQYLDSMAQSYGYDSIISACSYAAVPGTFQAEGIAFINWRTSVWNAAIIILADVEAETRAIPTAESILTELPVFTI